MLAVLGYQTSLLMVKSDPLLVIFHLHWEGCKHSLNQGRHLELRKLLVHLWSLESIRLWYCLKLLKFHGQLFGGFIRKKNKNKGISMLQISLSVVIFTTRYVPCWDLWKLWPRVYHKSLHSIWDISIQAGVTCQPMWSHYRASAITGQQDQRTVPWAEMRPAEDTLDTALLANRSLSCPSVRAQLLSHVNSLQHHGL